MCASSQYKHWFYTYMSLVGVFQTTTEGSPGTDVVLIIFRMEQKLVDIVSLAGKNPLLYKKHHVRYTPMWICHICHHTACEKAHSKNCPSIYYVASHSTRVNEVNQIFSGYTPLVLIKHCLSEPPRPIVLDHDRKIWTNNSYVLKNGAEDTTRDLLPSPPLPRPLQY